MIDFFGQYFEVIPLILWLRICLLKCAPFCSFWYILRLIWDYHYSFLFSFAFFRYSMLSLRDFWDRSDCSFLSSSDPELHDRPDWSLYEHHLNRESKLSKTFQRSFEPPLSTFYGNRRDHVVGLVCTTGSVVDPRSDLHLKPQDMHKLGDGHKTSRRLIDWELDQQFAWLPSQIEYFWRVQAQQSIRNSCSKRLDNGIYAKASLT
jgi:hypothetical protein